MKTLIITLALLSAGCASKKKFTVYIPVAVPTPGQQTSAYENGCTEALKRVGVINTNYRRLLEANGIKP